MQQKQLQNVECKINADLITKEMQCAICLNDIENCGLTRCGHVFCRPCIDEVINRHHRCPSCNQELKDMQTDVFTNFHFNNLRRIINEEKEKISKQELQIVFQQQDAEIEPIQNLFREHMAHLYFLYQQRINEANQQYKQKVSDIQSELESQLVIVFIFFIYKQEGINQQELVRQSDIRIHQAKYQLDIIKDFYVQGAKRNLENIKIDPAMLDIRVTLLVPSKNFRVESILFSPSKQINEIWILTAELLGKNNNPVVEAENLQLIVVTMEYHKIVDEFIQSNKEPTEQQITTLGNLVPVTIVDLKRLDMIATLNVIPGSIFYIVGQIKCKSDLPGECFTFNFQGEQLVDYYSCDACKLNWICPNCKDFCHKGHTTQLYLKQHKATWACCYCASKGKCKVPNNKNNKK